ncbi:putative pentatricopeptide repeat-containing protein At5g36300 [Raphanus sativus]|uniref:Pentatricopeptide repeat-containing protein At5g36300 n=1 Tax=Raphanus sativus TaxID=3726 RepID=A0A6J0NF94_RAPSA|nr:putative pentatricopeptide repeat-containing protein At5g36300 [Raphanus sativus]
MMSLRTYGSLIPGVPVSPSPTRIPPTLNSSRRLIFNCYSNNHQVSRQIVAEELSISMYNRWIRYCCKKRGGIEEAMSLLAELDSLGSHPEPLSYVTLIETLSDLGRTLEADALFQEAIRFGLHGSYPLRLYNALLGGYLRKGQLEFALRVLDRMELENVDKNQETCEILLNYYVTAGRLEESWRVVNEMKRRKFPLTSFVYGRIIRIYRDNGMWKKALGIVEEISEIGLPMDVVLYNSIIDTFGKYGELDEALQVLRKMQGSNDLKPDISTWSSLIRWHCHHGAVDKALELFTMMQDQGLYPDPRMFVKLITLLGEKGSWDMISKSFESIKCKEERRDTRAMYAALVEIVGQFGSFQDPEELVGKLKSEGVAPSVNMFCTLANAYAQQGLCNQTVKVLKMMEKEGTEPNLIMLNVLINAFGNAGKHMEALSIYHHIKESGFTPDVVTYSTLMKAFTRAKKYEKVPEIFREMEASGCSADRKARQLLQNALMVLDKRH